MTIKNKLFAKSKWIRAFFMIVFFSIAYLVRILVQIIAVFQFIAMLFCDQTNLSLKKFGKDLSQYYAQIILFLTYNTEQRPYPFGDWPRRAAIGDVPPPPSGPGCSHTGPGQPRTPRSWRRARRIRLFPEALQDSI